MNHCFNQIIIICDVLTMALFWRGQPQGVIVHTDSWTIAVLRVKFIRDPIAFRALSSDFASMSSAIVKSTIIIAASGHCLELRPITAIYIPLFLFNQFFLYRTIHLHNADFSSPPPDYLIFVGSAAQQSPLRP